MPCEKYKAALIEAASTGAELTPTLREHAAACPSCAAELAQQRRLFAAIDSSVCQTMNAPLPPALLHRFEARLAQEPQSQPSRSLKFSWLYTAAAFATAAAVILFALSHQHVHKSNSQSATLDQTAKTTSDHRPERMTAILQPASPEEIRRDREQHRRRAAHTVSASTTPPRTEPEVLVPRDQELLLAAYAQRLRDQKLVLQASLVGLDPIEPSTIGATEISNLEIHPLPDLVAK